MKHLQLGFGSNYCLGMRHNVTACAYNCQQTCAIRLFIGFDLRCYCFKCMNTSTHWLLYGHLQHVRILPCWPAIALI